LFRFARKWLLIFSDVCERHHESLGWVLWNYFIFGNDDKKTYVRDTISNIVDKVMDANSSNKGLSDLLYPETYKTILNTMRVPDWVLLYFKLQTNLPDSDW
jgi:hypothetical protein